PSPGAPGLDGQPLVFSVDLDATCASIAAACGPEDAAAYRRFVEVWAPRGRAVAASFGRRPDRGGPVPPVWPPPPRAGRPDPPVLAAGPPRRRPAPHVRRRPRRRLPRLRRRAPGPLVRQR